MVPIRRISIGSTVLSICRDRDALRRMVVSVGWSSRESGRNRRHHRAEAVLIVVHDAHVGRYASRLGLLAWRVISAASQPQAELL